MIAIAVEVYPVADRPAPLDVDILLFTETDKVGQLGAYVGDGVLGPQWVDVLGGKLAQKVVAWCELPRLR